MAGIKRKVTIEDLFRLRIVSQPAISPDGTQVVVAIRRCNLKKNKNFASLFLVSARGGRLRRLTTGNHSDTKPTWSPDGKVLAFLSDRDKASCVWLLPMEGGEPVRLTDRDHDVFDFSFSPDGKRIVYSARKKSERDVLRRDDKKKTLETTPDFVHVTRLFHKLDGVGFWNGHYVHIFSVKTNGGAAKQLTGGHWDHNSPQFSPDGKRVAFLSNRMPDPDRNVENMDIFTMPANGGRAKQITKREGPILNYSWSPDGREFAYVGHMGKTGEFSLYNVHLWTIPAGGGRSRKLTAHIDNSCFNATLSDVAEASFQADPPVWSSDGDRVYFVVSERGACNIHEARTGDGGSRPRVVGEHVITDLSRPTGTGPVVFVLATQTKPGDVFTLDIDVPEARPRQITHVNRAVLNGLALSRPEPLSVKRSGHTVHGWVMKPPGFSAKKGSKRKYPLVLQIHGGPYAQYGHGFFHEFQWLAARGYVVVFTNPRGSMGYGLKYATRLRHDWGGPDTPDLLACVDAAVRRGGIDRKRLYIAGGSYGGFMTNWVTARDHRFRAGVTQRCVSNMESMFASDYGWFFGYEVGCMPWQDPKRFRRASPIARVKDMKTPLLIIHSDQDLRCPLNQAGELFTALKYLGRDVECVYFAGEAHGLSRGGRPQNRAERLRRILDWFERHK